MVFVFFHVGNGGGGSVIFNDEAGYDIAVIVRHAL